MDPELRACLDEGRRHFDVAAERMAMQVQLVAGGVTALAERLEPGDGAGDRAHDPAGRPRAAG
jgi:hypothetical protein